MDIWFSANLKNNRSTDSSLFKKYFCVIYFKYFVCFCDFYNFLATIFSVFVDFFPPDLIMTSVYLYTGYLDMLNVCLEKTWQD